MLYIYSAQDREIDLVGSFWEVSSVSINTSLSGSAMHLKIKLALNIMYILINCDSFSSALSLFLIERATTLSDTKSQSFFLFILPPYTFNLSLIALTVMFQALRFLTYTTSKGLCNIHTRSFNVMIVLLL